MVNNRKKYQEHVSFHLRMGQPFLHYLHLAKEERNISCIMLLQQEAVLQEAVAQSQERERLLLDQQQQASCFCLSTVCGCFALGISCTHSNRM